MACSRQETQTDPLDPSHAFVIAQHILSYPSTYH